MACLRDDVDSLRDSESDEYDADESKRSPSPEIPLAVRGKRLTVKSFYHPPRTSPKEASLKSVDEDEARRRELKETYDVLTTFSGSERRHTAEVIRAGGRSKTKSTSHTPSRKRGGHINDPVSHLSDKLSARGTTTRKHVISNSDESSDDGMPGQVSKSKKTKVTEKEDVQDTLKEMKQMLRILCDKVDRNEKSLKELKTRPRDMTDTPSSSSSDCKSHKKKEIPLVVRQEVRKTYKTLTEEDENFGWYLTPGASIKSPENDAVIKILIKEVRGLNPSFEAHDIREAAYRFYKSKSEEESLQRSGKAESKKVFRRRHERITRKRKEREAALMKNSKLSDEQRKKWLAVVKNEYMSSEESGEEDTIVVHRLPWRSEYVNKMFTKIDEYCYHKKSPQAIRQMKARKVGSPSGRSKPLCATEPEWAFRQ